MHMIKSATQSVGGATANLDSEIDPRVTRTGLGQVPLPDSLETPRFAAPRPDASWHAPTPATDRWPAGDEAGESGAQWPADAQFGGCRELESSDKYWPAVLKPSSGPSSVSSGPGRTDSEPEEPLALEYIDTLAIEYYDIVDSDAPALSSTPRETLPRSSAAMAAAAFDAPGNGALRPGGRRGGPGRTRSGPSEAGAAHAPGRRFRPLGAEEEEGGAPVVMRSLAPVRDVVQYFETLVAL